MMEYDILENGSYPRLVQEVNKFIKNDWKPQGGVSSIAYPSPSGENTKCKFFQAITRES